MQNEDSSGEYLLLLCLLNARVFSYQTKSFFCCCQQNRGHPCPNEARCRLQREGISFSHFFRFGPPLQKPRSVRFDPHSTLIQVNIRDFSVLSFSYLFDYFLGWCLPK